MNSGCYMNGNFVGNVIYADDITLMGVYDRKHNILFNPVKTKCTFFPSSVNSVPR